MRGQGDGAGLLAVLATPEQREVLDRLTAFMSLVEGHAEYVMNAVPRTVIPSQDVIEGRFAQRRRHGGNPLDRLLRRLLGMDAKTRQYVDGSAFVRPRRRPGRRRRLQRDLDLARDAAHARREIADPAALDRARARLTP